MYIDRNAILKSDEFIAQVRVALCDWVEYWAVTGTASITDETLREQTDAFINVFLFEPEKYVQKLAYLAISEPAVKDAIEVTDINVKTAVDQLMSRALPYLL